MKDLRDWIAACENEGELKRITKEVDWELELGHVATLNERAGGPALLFEKVKDYGIPVLSSTVTTAKKMAITCGKPAHYTLCDVSREWKNVIQQGRLVEPVEVKDDIPVMYEVLEGDDVNVFDLPSRASTRRTAAATLASPATTSPRTRRPAGPTWGPTAAWSWTRRPSART